MIKFPKWFNNEKDPITRKLLGKKNTWNTTKSYINSLNLILPKGTLLYHGSLTKDIKFDPKFGSIINKILGIKNGSRVFFGLEPTISLAYLGEICAKSSSQCDLNGYLYVYELQEDTEFVKTRGHPDSNKRCRSKVCVNPQYTFRFTSKTRPWYQPLYWTASEYTDISIEATLPVKKIDTLLSLKKMYKVDITKIYRYFNKSPKVLKKSIKK